MKKITTAITSLFALSMTLFILRASLMAQEVPGDFNEATETAQFILLAFQNREWPLVAGALLMLLVFLARRFGLLNRFSDKVIPWVASGMGVIAAVGMALAGGEPIATAMLQGFMAGAAATGLWELVFKHLLPAPSA